MYRTLLMVDLQANKLRDFFISPTKENSTGTKGRLQLVSYTFVTPYIYGVNVILLMRAIQQKP
jgi:hypothetical protein